VDGNLGNFISNKNWTHWAYFEDPKSQFLKDTWGKFGDPLGNNQVVTNLSPGEGYMEKNPTGRHTFLRKYFQGREHS